MPGAASRTPWPAAWPTGSREVPMPNPPPPQDAHEEAEVLLPWYATGQLEPGERALVENHLESCAECKRLLALEHRMVEEFQALDPGIDSGWARLRGRIETQ